MNYVQYQSGIPHVTATKNIQKPPYCCFFPQSCELLFNIIVYISMLVNVRRLNWRHLPHVRSIYIYRLKSYSSSNLGSWRSPIDQFISQLGFHQPMGSGGSVSGHKFTMLVCFTHRGVSSSLLSSSIRCQFDIVQLLIFSQIPKCWLINNDNVVNSMGLSGS